MFQGNHSRLQVFGLLIVFCLVSSTISADEPPKQERDLGVEFHLVQGLKPHDELSVQVDARVVILGVLHRSGIGKGSVKRTTDVWPERLILRFEKFPALEGIEFRTEDLLVKGFLGFNDDQREGPAETLRILKDGTAELLPQEEWVSLSLRRKKTGIEVQVPAAILKSHPQRIEIRWVDAYRN